MNFSVKWRPLSKPPQRERRPFHVEEITMRPHDVASRQSHNMAAHKQPNYRRPPSL